MKARDYLERKRTRRAKSHWKFVPGERRGVYEGENGFIMCGTTADIDTEEKREAIAADAMGRAVELAKR